MKLQTLKNIQKISLMVLMSGAMVLIASYIHAQRVEAASADDIIINEIMYNPQSDVDNDEFLELYNTTGSSIDLNGWCFTKGITLCFSTSTILTAHGYGVVSPNASRTLSTYGKTTIGTYTGKLDNGGEQVTISDSGANIIDTVTYDDVTPWPTTPDGGGPSLELKNPNLDNSLASSWSASVGGATPGAINSVASVTLPTITNLSVPQNVTDGTQPIVTVQVTDADEVNLVYRVMFEPEQTITMHDDGANGDTTPNDNVYSSRLPAQAAGKLVRYKVSSENGNGTSVSPGGDDTINYKGYAVQDASQTSQMPILQLFMDQTQMDDMITNHSYDDQVFSCVIVYGNNTFDNAKIWVKGGVKRVFPKKSFAVDLPKGHKLLINGERDREVDEFHLDSDYIDGSGSILTTAWDIAKEQGMDVPEVFKTRLQHNGQFYGVYTFLEEYDNAWRDTFNYSSGSFYKTNTPKTTIADPTELGTFQENLTGDRTVQRRNYAIDNLDVPNIINYMAYMTIVHNWEWHNGKNINKYRDVKDTNRWKMLPQDIDGSMLSTASGIHTASTLVTPYDLAALGDSFDQESRFQFFALYEEPDFREMYYRRLRTMADEYYSNDKLLTMYRSQYQAISSEVSLDSTKWGTWLGPIGSKAKIENQISKVKTNLLVRFRKPWAIPAAQSASPVVDIDTVNLSSGNTNEQYIKLTNNTSESVDMSGWKLEEINYTLPPGSVILAGQSATLPKKDLAYHTAHPGTYILGEYKNSLSNLGGTLTLLRKDGSESNRVNYY